MQPIHLTGIGNGLAVAEDSNTTPSLCEATAKLQHSMIEDSSTGREILKASQASAAGGGADSDGVDTSRGSHCLKSRQD